MNGLCPKCGKHVEATWAFCPFCAAQCAHEAEMKGPRKHEDAPVKGMFSGFMFGLIAAPVLIIAGGMICLTGLGVFLGVPLIVMGMCAPLVGPLMGSNPLHGKCPWCDADVSGVGIFDHFSCPSCSRRIVMKKRELIRAR
jgi:endogenous inhibitor of DNA gyrase (YacG/DUF329 family)